MALVASSSNHSLNFCPDIYEWPQLNELYGYHEPRSRQVSILVRSVSYEHTTASGDNIQLILASRSTIDNFTNSTSEPSVDSTCSQCVPIDDVNQECEQNKMDVIINSNTYIETNIDLSCKSIDSEITEPTAHDILESLDQELCGRILITEDTPSEDHEDGLISNTSVSMSDNVNLDSTIKDNTCQNGSPKQKGLKKKKRFKKIRQKSMGKWREFDSAELGFRVAKLPHLLEEDLTFDSVDSRVGEVSQPEIPECSLESITEVCNSSNAQNDADSVDFFRALGIDVLNFDYNDEDDGFLQWDGVCFPPKRPATKPPQKPKQRVKPKVKSKLATNCQPGPSLQDDLKPNEDVQVHTLSPSTTVISKLKKCDRYKLFELECSSSKRIYIRRDRHRRHEKPHKAVKSKNSRFVLQNILHKQLYMHHRLIKMHSLDLYFRMSERSYGVPPMPKVKVAIDVAKGAFSANRKLASRDKPGVVQNLKHALHETNTSVHLELDLASFLISLQHREMTPEDYDMLLRLDDTVKPKTVSKNVLDNLRTETIGPNGVEQGSNEWEPLCTICMEPYSQGQERKFLPCDHDFHTPCIDTWLKNSSLNCPLDGLPIESY